VVGVIAGTDRLQLEINKININIDNINQFDDYMS